MHTGRPRVITSHPHVDVVERQVHISITIMGMRPWFDRIQLIIMTRLMQLLCTEPGEGLNDIQ